MIELQNIPNAEKAEQKRLNECWDQVLSRQDLGFHQLPARREDWDRIHDRIRDCAGSKHVIVVGIGGSSLGTKVIRDALAPNAKVFFLESIDPQVWTHLKNLEPEWGDAHVILVSKSGGTLETLTWAERLAAEKPSWLQPSRCTVIASPKDGLLQTWAEKHRLNRLWIPNDVGGRFSVLTAVGMLPAGLMGLSVEDFRLGAEWALGQRDLATQVSAFILSGWASEKWITQLWIYSESLGTFGPWWQQLWAESLAKKTGRTGRPAPRVSTPVPCVGPRDQHSLLQQLMEGYPDKQIFVMRVAEAERDAVGRFSPTLFGGLPYSGREVTLGEVLRAEAQAFEKSLDEAHIPRATILVKDARERSLGALFMLWQMITAQLGEYLDIDAFDQPGVEAGKIATRDFLRAHGAKNP